MRKIIFLITACALFLAGCGNDQYAVERRFWYAQKEAGKIFSNLEASPPNEVARVVKKLDGLAEQYPNTPLAVETGFTVARLYIAKKEYQQARVRLDGMIQKYHKAPQVCAEALFLIGNSYEQQERWDRALEHYKRLIKEYPITKRGLDVPMYIAAHYKNTYQPEKMLQAYQEAIAHYTTLAESNPKTQLAYVAYMLVGECYSAMKDWQQVVATLDVMAKKFKGVINPAEIQINKAMIYKQQLKDIPRARAILEELIKEYPKTKAEQVAKLLLKNIDKK